MSARPRTDPGGLSLGPLMIAGVLASPALWRALQQHQLPLSVALERLLVIAVVCVVVGDVVKRYLDVVPAAEVPAPAAAPSPVEPRPSASPPAAAPAAPMPFEQTPEWDSGDLDGADLFALDPLPGEDPHPVIG